MSNTNNKTTQKSKKRKNQWFFLLLIIVVLATVLVVASVRTEAVDSSTGTTLAERKDLTITVTEAGSITAHKSVKYEVMVERRGMGQGSTNITILQIVPQGTIVTQEDVDNGLVLCELDSAALEDQLVSEKMQLTSAEENVISYTEAYDIQVLDNETSISNAKLNLRFALLDLQKYLGKELANRMVADVNDVEDLTAYIAPYIDMVRNDPNLLEGSSAGQSLKSLQDNIVLNEGNLKTQQIRLEGTEKLYENDFVSDLDVESDRLTLKSRQFNLDNSYISQNLFLDYDFPKNAEQYLSNYREDLRNLNRIEAQCRSRLAQARSRLSSAQENFVDQEEQVELIKRQIENCTIVAKSTGMVVYGEGSSSDTFRMMRGMRGGGSGGMSSGTIAEGETVSPGQVIISMPDTSRWIAEISVHETDVDKVKAGQAAIITMDAFPDQSLTGIVTEVAPLPDQSRNMMNPDLKVYATKVLIDGTHDFLKAKMSCKVEILVNRVRNAIVLPVTVVGSSAGQKFCYIVNSAGARDRRDVQTGVFNDIYVEILQGITEGERVMLNPPVETSLVEVDLFEGVEAQPTTNGSNGARGTMQGGGRGQGMEGFEGAEGMMGGRGGFEGMGGRGGGEGMTGRGGGEGMGTGGRGGGMGGRGGGQGGGGFGGGQ